MAGVYGEIGSRADFYRVLGEAKDKSKQLLIQYPGDETFESIGRQLEEIDRWTARDRVPTLEERESLDMGLRAARELSDTGDPATNEYIQKIFALHNYFEDWPTDEEATNATDDDFFDGD